MKFWILVPAYNEAQKLGALLSQLKSKNYNVLVVDDGSVDETYQVAVSMATVVLRNEVNQGKGQALRKGIEYLLAHDDFGFLIIMDADGQHLPNDLDKFIQAGDSGAMLVIGDRMGNPHGMPLIRVWTNKFMSWLISQLAGQKVNDSQCGYRLIKKDLLEKLQLKTDNFEIESEIIIKTARLGLPIVSVPVESVYFSDPQSKIRPFKDTLRFFRFILRRI